MSDICIVFDLDDTLYKEINYVKSAYRYIATVLSKKGFHADEIYSCLLSSFSNGKNAFEEINKKFNIDIPISKYLEWYRFHFPSIPPQKGLLEIMKLLRSHDIPIGIITDGRSITQRNKIKSLELDKFINDDNVIISEEFGSEKPCLSNYIYFSKKYLQAKKFIYVGDNPQKDFVTPNQMGWLTIGLMDNGENIHTQYALGKDYDPQLWIDELNGIYKILFKKPNFR